MPILRKKGMMMSNTNTSPLQQIKLALAGFGTVGREVVRLLQEEKIRYQEVLGVDLCLVKILDRSYQQKDTSGIPSTVQFTESVSEFLQTPADIIIELLGGSDPADEIIRTALSQQKAVITANKLLMAQFGKEYLALCSQYNSYIGFEASVAGAIPIIRVLQRSLLSDQIMGIRGILNGTCNFILSEMGTNGLEYEEALLDAQSQGYAESDPTLDISGADTTDKLAILSAIAFNTVVSPKKIATQGITAIRPIDFLYAKKLNSTIKLLGVAVRNKDHICLRVSPFLISNRLSLSSVSGVLNAVEITGDSSGSVVLSGKGAGGAPTAVSVTSDILNATLWKKNMLTSSLQSTDLNSSVGNRKNSGSPDSNPIADKDELYPFFMRFTVQDRPGIIAELANILAERNINIDAVLEESCSDPSNLSFIITVKPIIFSAIQEAVEQMKSLDFNQIPPLVLPRLQE
jgi:homoserine dehydrogenase